MRVTNRTQHTEVAREAHVANTFWRRLLGLMGRRHFGDADGLLIFPTNAIHTCFMRFPIDVIFLSRTREVLAVYPSLRPWRATRPVRGAHYVLELPPGTIQRSRTRVGDHLEWGTSPKLG